MDELLYLLPFPGGEWGLREGTLTQSQEAGKWQSQGGNSHVLLSRASGHGSHFGTWPGVRWRQEGVKAVAQGTDKGKALKILLHDTVYK